MLRRAGRAAHRPGRARLHAFSSADRVISRASRRGRSTFVDPAPAIARRVDSLLGRRRADGASQPAVRGFLHQRTAALRGLQKALRRLGLTATSAANAPRRSDSAAAKGKRAAASRVALPRATKGRRNAHRSGTARSPRGLSRPRLPGRYGRSRYFARSPGDARRRDARHAAPPAGPAPTRALELDGDELELVAAALDGAPLAPGAYKATPSGFALPNPPRRPFTLRMETRLDPAANTKLMGLYRSGSAYCTQCEAEGFRRITYFPDRPDVLSTYRVRLEADKAEAPVLLANGNLESERRSGGRPSLGGLARSVQEALLSLRRRRRRSRPCRRHVRHHVGAARRARRLCRARAARSAPPMRWTR